MRSFAALVAVAVACALPIWEGTASAANPGGAQAPSEPVAGGSEYGVTSSSPAASRPLLRELAVPARVRAGASPRITLRVDEAGTPTVRARLVVLLLPSHRAAARIDLGNVTTGRSQALAWPRRTRLKPGSYLVQFHAYDAQGKTLLRPAQAARRAVMSVVPASSRRPSGSGSTPVPSSGSNPLQPPSFTPTPPGASVTAPVHGSGVFPVLGPHSYGGAGNRFGAGRAGHIHQGQDVLAAEGTPVAFPFSGTVIAASYQAAAAGYYVAEHGSDGRDYFFAHCEHGSTAVSVGETVAAGQRVCLVGHTGDATAPHLHFEIWVGGWHTAAGYPIDPLPDLQSWDRGA